MQGTGAIPAASTFSVQASTGDSGRQNTAKLHDGEGFASREDRAVLRQEATVNGGSRPGRATESATVRVNDDPDLAAVVTAWPNLPDSVRAGILVMATGLEHVKNSV
jgi:hypothetical protein